MDFLSELYNRNDLLAVFGWICVGGMILCLLMMQLSSIQVLGINAWIKPFKFFASTVIFVWSMSWYLSYLNASSSVRVYSWVVIVTLSFELIYITLQAAKGELSHFNVSSSFHGSMFGLMGVAISIMTLFTFYMGMLFFTKQVDPLPTAYLWGIRLGIIFFVIFAFEGGMMGARLAHTVGAPDGGPGIKLLNWSLTHGDLRIAHFTGMHALQVLPIIGYFLLTSTRGLFIFSTVYFIVVFSILMQALRGLPLIKG